MAAFLADALVAIHLTIAVFVAGLPVLVFLGWPLGWRWIRNPVLRLSHLAIVAYVVINALVGNVCFLTHWERALRERAGRAASDLSFVGGLLRSMLYIDVEQRVLDNVYIGLGVLVLFSTLLVKPRWRASASPLEGK